MSYQSNVIEVQHRFSRRWRRKISFFDCWFYESHI